MEREHCVCLCPPKNLQLLHPPCSLKPSLALTAGQGRRGIQEWKILGYHDINLHVSFLLCVQEVGSGAMRLLAPVSLGMPACSPEEIEEIGLAPPEATPHHHRRHHQLFFFSPLLSFSPSLLILGKPQKGFVHWSKARRLQRSAEYDMQEDRGFLSLYQTMTCCNATHFTSLIMNHSSMFTGQIFHTHCL